MKRWHDVAGRVRAMQSPCARASSAGGRPSTPAGVVERRERSAAAPAAACRAALPSPTCRAAPARCGWRARSAPACVPWPRMPRRDGVRIRDAAELVAADAGDAVVLRQPFVHERVVGAIEIEQAAVFLHQAVEEQLRLGAHRRRRGSRRSSDRSSDRGGPCRRPAAAATARRTACRARRSARIGEHAARLLLEHARLARQLAGGRRRRSVPCPAACPTGRTTGATPGRCRRRDTCRPSAHRSARARDGR